VATQNLTYRVSEEGDIHEGHSVCDIGCGYGATALMLAEDFCASVTEVTITLSQYEKAKLLQPKQR